MLVGILSSEEIDDAAAVHHERVELVLSQSLVVQLTAGYWPERDWIRPYLWFYINSDISGHMPLKRVTFHGDSLDRFTFSEDARREAGHELTRSRRVMTPVIGSRCQRSVPVFGKSKSATRLERTRVIYIATFPDAIHVLHAFEKKTQKTAGAIWSLRRHDCGS